MIECVAMEKRLNVLTEKYLDEYKGKAGNLAGALEKLKAQTKSVTFEFMIESSAVFSSNIEGNPIDLNSWMNGKRQKEKSQPKAHQEIRDLIEAYRFAKSNPLTEDNILTAHGMLSQQFLIKTKQGKYREERVGIHSARGLVYVAVEPEFVQREMKFLFDDIAALLRRELSFEERFYYASEIHLRFAQIHPFADGNGRVARLLEKWFLSKHIGEIVWKMSSEEYYWNNRPTYYENINLGVNYYELDYSKCLPFLLMLPKAMERG